MTSSKSDSGLGGPGDGARVHPSATRRCDAGSATAEFAVALLALIAAVVPLLSGIEYLVRQAQVQEVARAAARQLSRGDDPSEVVTRARTSLPGVSLRSWPDADLTRVQVTAEVELLMGLRLPLNATATTITEDAP